MPSPRAANRKSTVQRRAFAVFAFRCFAGKPAILLRLPRRHSHPIFEFRAPLPVDDLPDSCQVMVVVLRDKVRVIYQPHGLLQPRMQQRP